MTGINDKSMSVPYFTGQWCDATGNLTPLAAVVLRALMNRTGYAPGISATENKNNITTTQQIAEQAEADAMVAAILGLNSGSMANAALSEARQALSLAQQTLIQAQSIRAQALKALELARDYATISATARGNAQAAQSPDESMVLTIMKP